MRVLTSKVIRIDAFALIHLDMLTFVTIVKVKNDHVYQSKLNTKKVEDTNLRPLSNQRNNYESVNP